MSGEAGGVGVQPSTIGCMTPNAVGCMLQEAETFVDVSHVHRKESYGSVTGANELGVHIETMRRWAREGVIPAAKLGNRGGFRFKREDLDRFLESRREG